MRFFLESFMDYLTDRHLLRNSLKVEGEYIRMELDTTALAKQFIEHRRRKIEEACATLPGSGRNDEGARSQQEA